MLLQTSVQISQTWSHGYLILLFQNDFPIKADSWDHPLLEHHHIGRVQIKVTVLFEELLCGLQGELAGHYIPVSTQHKAEKGLLELMPVYSNVLFYPYRTFRQWN